ncbi:MAG: recombinase family protein, partial [Bacilli bacterium]
IVRTLQAAAAPPPPGGWSVYKVAGILSNDIYRGVRVYGRSSARLRTRRRPTPEAEWVKARVARPLVSARTFARAQALRKARYRRRTREDVVEALRQVLAREGRLSSEILDRAPEAPNKAVVQAHCGSLPTAFAMAGQPIRRGQRKWRRETLIEELRRVQAAQGATDKAALSRDPLAPAPYTFVRHFGSLQAAQAAAGVPATPVRPTALKPRLSTASLLAALRRLQRRKGRLTWADIEADSHVSARTVRRRFGGLEKVLAALEIRPGR